MPFDEFAAKINVQTVKQYALNRKCEWPYQHYYPVTNNDSVRLTMTRTNVA
jgi:hypothetical protein